MSPALITCLRLRQVPRDPEGPDGAGRGEAAHPQGGVRSVEESPAGTPSPVRMCKHIKMWTFGFKRGASLRCVADDRGARGQNDPDPDRGLCCGGQLALLSGYGSRVHQVRPETGREGGGGWFT